MVLWLKNAVRALTKWAWADLVQAGLEAGGEAEKTVAPLEAPRRLPAEKVETDDRVSDHVFSIQTGYLVVSKPRDWFKDHPRGEGNPDLFVIVRSSRKLPDQADAEGRRIRQLDLDRLAELPVALEDRLANVVDLDNLDDESFNDLWLEGSDDDFLYWSGQPLVAVSESKEP